MTTLLVVGGIVAILAIAWRLYAKAEAGGRAKAERDQLAHTSEVKDKQLQAVVDAPKGREGVVGDIRERGVF